MVADDHCPPEGRPEVAGWVLGAMEPKEALRFGEHLLTCGECQAAIAEVEAAGRMLLAPQLLPVAQPPADLMARTLARVQQAALHDQQLPGTISRYPAD